MKKLNFFGIRCLYRFVCQYKNLGEFNIKRNKTFKEGYITKYSILFCNGVKLIAKLLFIATS